MELCLNFVWVLLFVPAWWVWRRNPRQHASLRCLLTLACSLVILFPVISATDDLHAAPQAMEESSSTKRALRHANLDKAHNGSSVLHPHISIASVRSPLTAVALVSQEMPARAPRQNRARATRNRAPPRLFFA